MNSLMQRVSVSFGLVNHEDMIVNGAHVMIHTTYSSKSNDAVDNESNRNKIYPESVLQKDISIFSQEDVKHDKKWIIVRSDLESNL